jgi:hypothetical protein
MLLQLRIWVALVTFGLFAITAQAQTPAPAMGVAPATTASSGALKQPAQVPGKYKNYLMQRYANDTGAQAIVQHFSRHQTGGELWLGIGAATIGAISTQTGTTTTNSGTTTFKVTPLGYGILVGLFGGIGVGKLVRFSNAKLYETLLAYEQRQANFSVRAANGQ